ncbi:MAG TPA: hypothetical protein VIG33_08355 [Pseudobdellovibrionaceae bacterium]|jgi:hypothetical protein
MKAPFCSICQKPKATLECGICKNAICKKCAQFIDEDTFSFLPHIPVEFSTGTFCGPCFDFKVSPEIETYNQTMEAAKEIAVFFNDQGKETRLVKRLADPVQVVECKDRDETVLRLAFFAAQGNYNGIVDVDVKSEKVKNGTYQTLRWRGTAIPANIDPKKLNK